MRRRRSRSSRPAPSERGYALLALIIAMMVIAISMTVAVPDAKNQAKRERETEMFFRGEEMAEAIARYYSGGKLSPAGLVVKTPPPPYGFLTDLKKLRDGVTVGNDEIFFARASACIDPLTDGEWEPVRIGDPRLRKFFRAWQQSTGRQLPPIYASYLGAGAIVDTREKPEGEDLDGDGQPDNPDAGSPDADDDEEFDDEGDEDDDEYDDEEDDEEDDGDESFKAAGPGASIFVRTAYQTSETAQPQTTDGGTADGGKPGTTRRPFKNPFAGQTTRLGPIIGVVSKAKGESLRTRYGIKRYEEMLFVYIPPQPILVPNQTQQVQQEPSGGQTITNDADGDGIDDSLTPNPKPEAEEPDDQ